MLPIKVLSATDEEKRKQINSYFVPQSLKYKGWKRRRSAYYQSAERRKLNNPKNSILLGVIVSVIMTLISTVKSMISVVRVTTGGWLTEAKTTWEWSNLKEINYVKLIGQDLFLIF